MEKPFVFGIPASGENFTDRKVETERLRQNFMHGINTILISPRRWGKTSLVKKVVSSIDDPKIKIVYLDIFSCRSEYDFYDRFVAAVIKQTSSRFEEWIENAKRFLSRISPRFSFGEDPMNDFSISLDINNRMESFDDILQLPEKIAIEKGLHIVVCIDEFQQIGEFQNSLSVQKKLRTIWQLQTHTSYCLFGSKRHLMNELFESSSRPFYKFGDIINLKKIPVADWVEYIMMQFKSTEKSITAEQAEKICTLVDCNSSYVQQLAWIIWVGCAQTVSDDDVNNAFTMLLDQNSTLFEKQTEDLTSYQLSYLRAMTSGIETGFSKKEIVDRFNLGSSANVKIVQKALQKKEIIYIEGRKSIFCDPLLPLWLKANHF